MWPAAYRSAPGADVELPADVEDRRAARGRSAPAASTVISGDVMARLYYAPLKPGQAGPLRPSDSRSGDRGNRSAAPAPPGGRPGPGPASATRRTAPARRRSTRRANISGWPESGSPKTMIPPTMPGDVGGGAGDRDHRDGLAVLQALGRGVEGGDRGDDGDQRPRAEQPERRRGRRPCPEIALMATSETPNRIPAAAPSMKPWCSSGAPMRGPMMSSVPATSRTRLEADHGRDRELRVGAVDGREAEAQQQQADGGQDDPDPLPAGDASGRRCARP